MVTRKQVSISLLNKNTRKYKYCSGSNLFDVFVFNKTEFSQAKCNFFVTKHKEFLKDKKSPLDVALFFVL